MWLLEGYSGKIGPVTEGLWWDENRQPTCEKKLYSQIQEMFGSKQRKTKHGKKLQINNHTDHTIYFNFETSRLFRTAQRKWFWICIPRLVMDKRTVSTFCSLLSRGSASDNWNKEVDSLKLLQKNFQLVGPANTSCCMFKSHQNHAESVLTMHITICLQIVSQIPLGCLLQEIALQSVSIAVHFIDGAMLSKAKHAMGGAV